MRTIAALTTIAVLVGATGVALAQGVNSHSKHEPQQQTISINAMKQKIDALGYDVLRLTKDDGVFKAKIVDRQSGGVVRASFDLASGELVRAELDS
jgi:peptidase YpeB-like protein